MSYRLMTKEILKKLDNKEAYTFCCILLNSESINNMYISHIKQESLAEITGYHIDTIRKYIKKFQEEELLNIETLKMLGTKGYFNRNVYHIPIPKIDWYRVGYEFILTDKPSDVKGYLLLLKCICYGGSNTTLYSLNEINKKNLLQVGRNTILKLNREAISLGVISKQKSGYTITEPNIYADPVKEEIPSDAKYLDYYEEIVKYCKDRKVSPPKYDEELMKTIYFNYPVPVFLFDKMSNTFCTKTKIYSLEYFITVLNMKRPIKREANDTQIIL